MVSSQSGTGQTSSRVHYIRYFRTKYCLWQCITLMRGLCLAVSAWKWLWTTDLVSSSQKLNTEPCMYLYLTLFTVAATQWLLRTRTMLCIWALVSAIFFLYNKVTETHWTLGTLISTIVVLYLKFHQSTPPP